MSEVEFFVIVTLLLIKNSMSFLGDFFQTVFGGAQYSSSEKALSLEEIQRLVSTERISSLDQAESKLIQNAIAEGRAGDGKISLAHIDRVLGKLESTKKISQYDRQGVMKVFQNYLGTR